MEARGLGEEEGAEEAEGTRTEACEVVAISDVDEAAPERRGGTEGKEDEEEEEAEEAERACFPPPGDGEPGFGEEAPS